MNEEAVCSQGSLASCRRCCARRARLTLNPVAWPGTNICTEQLGTAWGHLGIWHSWALPGDTWEPSTSGHCLGTPGHPAQPGTACRDTGGLSGLGNMACRRARGSDSDSVAVPAAVPGPLGHVGPSPARAVCLGSRLSQPRGPSPAAPLPQCFLLQFQVTMGQHPQGLPLWLRLCLGGTVKPLGWSGCCLLLSLVLNAPRFPKKPLIPPGSAPASVLGPVSSANPLCAGFRDALGAATP